MAIATNLTFAMDATHREIILRIESAIRDEARREIASLKAENRALRSQAIRDKAALRHMMAAAVRKTRPQK